jgi:hypothetical protein
MDGFTLKTKAKRRLIKEEESRLFREVSDEWQLAAGLKNHHRFELDDWIPTSYLEMSDDELMML